MIWRCIDNRCFEMYTKSEASFAIILSTFKVPQIIPHNPCSIVASIHAHGSILLLPHSKLIQKPHHEKYASIYISSSSSSSTDLILLKCNLLPRYEPLQHGASQPNRKLPYRSMDPTTGPLWSLRNHHPRIAPSCADEGGGFTPGRSYDLGLWIMTMAC